MTEHLTSYYTDPAEIANYSGDHPLVGGALDHPPLAIAPTAVNQRLLDEHPDAAIPPPWCSTELSAGLDLQALITNAHGDPGGRVRIMPGQSEAFHTGWRYQVWPGFWAGVYVRSGLGFKHGLRPSNCVAVIDADFRGEVIVKLHNDKDDPYEVIHGDRIAQLIIQVVIQPDLVVFDELPDTARGSRGFGHTGK